MPTPLGGVLLRCAIPSPELIGHHDNMCALVLGLLV